MIIQNEEDLTLTKQGLVHVYNFHRTAAEYELSQNPGGIVEENSMFQFHSKKQKRVKILIEACDTNLEHLATAEKSSLMKKLNQAQLIDLRAKGYTTVSDQKLYLKKKVQQINHAHKLALEEDQLFTGGEHCFLLSPYYQEQQPIITPFD